MKYSVEIAELLVKHRCSPSERDNDGLTPVMYAVQQVTNFFLIFQFLFSSNCDSVLKALHFKMNFLGL